MSASLVRKLGTAGGSANPVITVASGGAAVGDLVVVAAMSNVNPPTSYTDSRGNTYTAGTLSNSNTGGCRLYWSLLTTALQAGDSITPAGGGGNTANAAATFTGITAGTVDRQAVEGAASGTTWNVGPSAATQQASELVVCAMGCESAVTVTVDATYSLLDSFSSTVTVGWGYKVLAVAGAQSADYTDTSVAHDGAMATFRATPTPSPAGDPQLFNDLSGPGVQYGPNPFVEEFGDTSAPTGPVSETPPPGGAIAQGNGPVVQVAVPVGGAVAQGNPPSPSVAVPQGGAVAQGVAPTVTVTFSPGGAVAQGVGPTAKVDVAARGQAIAGGQLTDPLGGGVSETPPPGGALAQGLAPSPQVAVPQGGAVAQGTPATIRVSLLPGGALAQGTAPGPSVTPGVGAAVAQGTTATARVAVLAGGAIAGGQLTDPSGVQPPGAVSVADTVGNAVAVVDADSGATAAQEATGAAATVTDGSGAASSADAGTGADVTIVEPPH